MKSLVWWFSWLIEKVRIFVAHILGWIAGSMKWACAPFFALTVVSGAQGVVRYVDFDAGSDSNTGLDSWSNAKKTLQAALALAEPSDQIWVAASTTPYTPTVGTDPNSDPYFASTYGPDDEDRMLTFQLVKNVGIYGGFLGNATGGGETMLAQADPVNNVTILSGDLGEDGSAYHVLYYFQPGIDNEPPNELQFVIDGFTITGGNADGGDDTTSQGGLNAMGGGALIVFEFHFEWQPGHEGVADPGFLEPNGPVFSRCKFTNNSANLAGGAIAGIYNGGRIIDCTFINNEQASTTEGNFGGKTLRGGGAINVLGPVAVLRSTFIENESVAIGGAIHHSGFPGPMEGTVVAVTNCKFQENSAPNGGGIGSVPCTVANSLFVGNSATEGTTGAGGGLYNAEGVTGCTFVRNHAKGPGGGR